MSEKSKTNIDFGRDYNMYLCFYGISPVYLLYNTGETVVGQTL